MKRASSLKDPSCSTWEDLCFLEVDSLDKDGQVSFVQIFAKYRKRGSIGGTCEAEPKSVNSVETKTSSL